MSPKVQAWLDSDSPYRPGYVYPGTPKTTGAGVPMTAEGRAACAALARARWPEEQFTETRAVAIGMIESIGRPDVTAKEAAA